MHANADPGANDVATLGGPVERSARRPRAAVAPGGRSCGAMAAARSKEGFLGKKSPKKGAGYQKRW
jgi:hypothetical protein